jgi:hypothetical protein
MILFIAPGARALGGFNQISSLDIISYWAFDQDTGTVLIDSSTIGYAFNGVIHNGRWTDGRRGNGMYFNGNACLIDCGSYPLLHDTFTVVAWVKVTGANRDNPVYGIAGLLNFTYAAKSLTWNISDKYNALWQTPDTPLGIWRQMAVVYGANYQKIFADGKLLNTRSGTTFKASEMGQVLTLFPNFQGLADEVVIFRRPLSDAEVKSVYQAYGPAEKKLVVHWDFDEGTDTVLHDLSGQGHNGINYGATWTTGLKGSALFFDGTTDVVKARVFPLLNESFTLCEWVNLDRGDNVTNLRSFAKFSAASWEFSFGYKTFQWRTYDNKNPEWLTQDRDRCGKWTRVANVYDSLQQRLYINGRLVNSRNISRPILGDTSLTLLIGAPYFWGKIDELKIWNYALANADIQADYQSYGIFPPEVIHFVYDTVHHTAPVLRWYTVAGATSYRLIVDDNPSFSSPITDTIIADTSFGVLASLPLGPIYWKVSSNLDYAMFSDPEMFIVTNTGYTKLTKNQIIDHSNRAPYTYVKGDVVMVFLGPEKAQSGSIEIYDINGRKLAAQTIQTKEQGHYELAMGKAHADMKPTGCCIMRIRTNNKSWVIPLLFAR